MAKEDTTKNQKEAEVEKTEDVKVEKSESVEATKDEKVEADKEPKKSKKKKKTGKNITLGNAFVKATFNNTIISITDLNGNVIASGSAGNLGYSGSKKSTPYVAGLVAGNVAAKAKSHGVADVNVFIKGIGSGRESAVRGLQSSGINIISIKDVTPLPHNGCKRPRVRRV